LKTNGPTHSVGLAVDHLQQGTRSARRLASALFPFLDSPDADTKNMGKGGLGHLETRPHIQGVDGL